MDKFTEKRLIEKLHSMADEINKFRNTGKELISSLEQHITEKHSGYLTVKNKKDLEVTLEFFGIQILVKAEIPFNASFQEYAPPSTLKGNIVGYLLPEKEEDDRETLFSYEFDELGNVHKSLHTETFPIHFIKHLITELIPKGRMIS